MKTSKAKTTKNLPVPPTFAEINAVLSQVTQAFRSLAWNAGDVEEWNAGGEAYEASQALRALRAKVELFE